MKWYQWLACALLDGPAVELQEFLRLASRDHLAADPAKILDEDLSERLQRFFREHPKCWGIGEKNYRDLKRSRLELLTPLDSDYPTALKNTEFPPVGLIYQGRVTWNQNLCFSIVGSRDCTSEALGWMDQNISPLLDHKVVIVSGGARGVDQKAHLICLKKQAPTIVVLPSGLNRIYPGELLRYVEPILECGGTLVSEFAPETEMKKYHFQRRNRIIAALGSRLLVVEAQRKSGSLITAHHAIEQGREVLVVPHAPWNSKGLGATDLIVDGATPVRDFEDILLALTNLNPRFSEKVDG